MRNKIKSFPIIGTLARMAGDWWRLAKRRNKNYSFYLRNKKYLAVNTELKDKYKDGQCFVMATGPSVKNQNLKLLAGRLSISVSNFFVHPDFKTIRPEFHIFASAHKPITVEQMVAWFRDAEKHFPEGQKVFVSLTDRCIVEQYNFFKKSKVFYYLANDDTPGEIASIDFTSPVPAMKTVTHLAVYIAIYLGCKDLFLIGCDHNWAEVPGQNMHFYEERQHVIFGQNKHDKPFEMQDRFKGYYNLWEGYKKIRTYCKKISVNIWNITPGSLLDVFPRKTLESAINDSPTHS